MMRTVKRWAVLQEGGALVWVAARDDAWAKKGAKDAVRAFTTIPFKPKPCRLVRIEIREVEAR